MILSKEQLVVLIFLLAATMFVWGAIQTKMVLDMGDDVKILSEGVIACGDLDARIHRLESGYVQR